MLHKRPPSPKKMAFPSKDPKIDPKICEHCGKEYYPHKTQGNRQKYCGQSCKSQASWKRLKDSGNLRGRKGGYNRLTYIRTWLKSMDLSAKCFYCSKRLLPGDKWVLDHMTPVSKLTTRKEMQSEKNLVIACIECNVKKGSTPFDEFMKQIEKNE